MVRDVLLKHDRRNNPDEWENKTVPVAPDAIPAIVSPEQWERVQAKLKDAADLNNRGGPRRTDAEANSPLLDHGYIFCAECGGKMNRHWETKSNHPYYRCFKAGDRPSHPHIGFHVPAHAVDALTLRLLAKALTDPEKILEIASAAEEQLVEASADAELAASALAAYHKRLADITAEQDKLLAAIANLRGTTGTDTVVAGIQARLAQLNNDREEAENDHQHAIPLRDHAQSRAEFLRTMFAVRNRIVDFSTGETGDDGESHIRIGMPGIQMGDDGEPVRYSTLKLSHAAALLGVTEEELELPLTRGERFTFKKDDGSIGVDEAYDTVETADVVYCLLANMPRDRTRKLLHDLDAVVKVTRGRTRAEINAGVKKPPLADRVYLELLGTVQVRIDVKNLKISSYGCLCSFGPAPGGRSTQMKETLLSPCR
jgi:hypothetical protein